MWTVCVWVCECVSNSRDRVSTMKKEIKKNETDAPIEQKIITLREFDSCLFMILRDTLNYDICPMKWCSASEKNRQTIRILKRAKTMNITFILRRCKCYVIVRCEWRKYHICDWSKRERTKQEKYSQYNEVVSQQTRAQNQLNNFIFWFNFAEINKNKNKNNKLTTTT